MSEGEISLQRTPPLRLQTGIVLQANPTPFGAKDLAGADLNLKLPQSLGVASGHPSDIVVFFTSGCIAKGILAPVTGGRIGARLSL